MLGLAQQGCMATGRSLSLQKCRAHYRWTVTGVGIRKIMFELPRRPVSGLPRAGVGSGYIATGGVGSPGDGEVVVHLAVAGSAQIALRRQRDNPRI